MTTKKEREQKAEDNYYKKKQKKPINWDNLLNKCEKCGSNEIERMNLYQGMYKHGKGDNYQMARCKKCGHEKYLRI